MRRGALPLDARPTRYFDDTHGADGNVPGRVCMIVCMLTDTLEHMLRVAVVNQKGGVGKTTVTLGLAGAAQAAGMRVLVVDSTRRPTPPSGWT